MTPLDMDDDIADAQVLMPDDLAAKWDALGPERELFKSVPITPELNRRMHVRNLLSFLPRPEWSIDDAMRLARVFPDGLGILGFHNAKVMQELWRELDEADRRAAAQRDATIRVLTPADCETARPAPYVIKRMLGLGDCGVLVSAPGGGKSAVGPFLGYAVAQNRRIFGRRVRHGPVLYLSSEDGTGMQVRIRALRKRWGEAPNFYLVPHAIDLMDPNCEQFAAVKDLISRLRPILVIIDTVAASFPGLQESEGDIETGMGRVAHAAREIASICCSAVLMLHHPPLGDVTRSRGHSALNADVDVHMWIEGEKGQPRTVRFSKNRNGTSDQTLTFAICVDTLGEDEDGDPITAAIAEEIEATETDGLRAKEMKLSDKPATLLREFRNALAEHGRPVSPTNEMAAVIGITREMLRQRLIAVGWFAENLLCLDDAGITKLARSGYAPENNALTTLKRNGFLGCDRSWIWSL